MLSSRVRASHARPHSYVEHNKQVLRTIPCCQLLPLKILEARSWLCVCVFGEGGDVTLSTVSLSRRLISASFPSVMARIPRSSSPIARSRSHQKHTLSPRSLNPPFSRSGRRLGQALSVSARGAITPRARARAPADTAEQTPAFPLPIRARDVAAAAARARAQRAIVVRSFLCVDRIRRARVPSSRGRPKPVRFALFLVPTVPCARARLAPPRSFVACVVTARRRRRPLPFAPLPPRGNPRPFRGRPSSPLPSVQPKPNQKFPMVDPRNQGRRTAPAAAATAAPPSTAAVAARPQRPPLELPTPQIRRRTRRPRR